MAKALENYIPVTVRIKNFREKFENGVIKTTFHIEKDSDGDPVAVLRAEIYDGERLLGSGHGFAADLSEEKEFEKAESVAVGRALAHSGFPASLEELDEDEENERPKTQKKRGILGKSKKVEPEEDDEDEESEESEEEDDDSDDDDPDEDEDDSEDEGEADEPKAKKHTKSSLLEKYKKKEKKG